MKIQKLAFEAIGTKWSIDFFDVLAPAEYSRLSEKVRQRIEAFDKNYSRFRPDSLITKMSKAAGRYRLPGDGHKLLNFYDQLYHATDGLVTPLIGQALSDAGYDAGYSFQPKNLQQPPAWDEAIRYGAAFIELKRPALLDFGAAGKGYLIDIISQLVSKAGIKNYVINAGGDILQRGSTTKPVQIGLENPFDTAQVIGVAKLANKSLCASAGSRRHWGKYNHLLNPQTLESPNKIAATWVMADDAMTADGFSTALFFVEPHKLLNTFNFSYAILYKDMSLVHSPDFTVKAFETNK